MITTYTDLERDLNIHRVSGDITTIDVLRTFDFLRPSATSLTLWDLRETYNVSAIGSDLTDNIVNHLKDIPTRQDGRVAFVFGSPSDYGIGRMYESYSRSENLHFILRVFEHIGDAEAWLSLPVTNHGTDNSADD